MHRTIPALMVGAMLATSAMADEIREHCEKVHGDNFQHQLICVEQNQEAREALSAVDVEEGSPPARALAHCRRVHGANWHYARVCYEQQLEAIEKLYQ